MDLVAVSDLPNSPNPSSHAIRGGTNYLHDILTERVLGDFQKDDSVVPSPLQITLDVEHSRGRRDHRRAISFRHHLHEEVIVAELF